jgi:PAS domain S-box-containing protein
MLTPTSTLDRLNGSFAPTDESERQPLLLNHLWEAVNYGLFVLDVLEDGREFRFVAFNPAIRCSSPIPVDFILNKTLTEAFPDEIASVYRQYYSDCVFLETSISFEERSCLEGQETWWLMTVNPLYHPEQPTQVDQLLVTAIDITDRVRQERDRTQAQAEEDTARRLLQQILDSIPIGIFWKDQNSVFQGCNRAGLAACALSSVDAIVGLTDYDLPWTTDEADWYQLCDRRVMASGQAELNIVETQRRANGQQVILNTNKVPLQDGMGQVTGILVTVEDITPLKNVEFALRQSIDRQELLSHLTHQIRNSLDVDTILKTTIQGLYTRLHLDWCAFSWYDPTVQPACWDVVVDQSWDGQSWVGRYSAEAVSAIDPIALKLAPIRIDQAALYEEPTHRAFLQGRGTQSQLAIPIQTQREQVGLIICDYQQIQHTWTDEEVAFLQAVASQLAIAIDQAELYAKSRAKSEELHQALQEIQRTQVQLIQSEKMSSLGQLVAGIAHEINNPVNFIHGNVNCTSTYVTSLLELVTLYQKTYSQPTAPILAKIAETDLSFIREDLPKVLRSMKIGSDRITEIVNSLRLFSRLDESEVKSIDIHEGIESAIMILHHRTKELPDRPEIQIIKHYGQLPLVQCFAGQLNQVIINLLMNAIDAVNETNEINAQLHPKIIRITTSIQIDGTVMIKIADNGIGIAEEVKHQIFDPFFTTKPIGKGTGMGLSISYQLITEKHGGQLFCHSVLGKGTEFVIQIPRQQVQTSMS